MSAALTSVASAYLEAGVGLALLAVLLAAVVRLGGLHAGGGRWVTVIWALVALALVAPGVWRLGGVVRKQDAAIEVWGRGLPELPGLRAAGAPVVAAGRLPVRGDRWRGLWVARPIFVAAAVAFGLGVTAAAGRALLRRRRLRRFCADLPVLKRRGRVTVAVSDVTEVPFAARFGRHAYIVVPTALLADPARLRLVIAHEAAHHRRGDLRSAGWLVGLRALYFWHPALGWLARYLRDLEDLACDRLVLARRGVSARAYGEALLWAAERARADGFVALAGHAMASASMTTMQRRIVMLGRRENRRGVVALGAALAAIVLLGSWTVRGAVGERRVSAAEVAAAAAKIEARAGFAVMTHAKVVDAVNYKVGSPEGRTKLKQAFARLAPQRAAIEAALAAKKVPRELVGLALAESGFDNQARTSRPWDRQAGGIWQLMPATARKLGLEVSPGRDERFEPARASEAAASFLADLHTRFGDWPIAIAAYNLGEKAMTQLIAGASREEARTRIIESDKEFGRYLATVMASIILLDNPSMAD